MKRIVSPEKEYEFDVCVCGGGPAGFCAAVAAARSGAKTALVERYGALGGCMTVGGIPEPALFHAHGKQVIAGIAWELMEHLAANGDAILPPPPYIGAHPDLCVRLNAFQAAVAMDDFCREAGVTVFFHQPLCQSFVESGIVEAVWIATRSGVAEIRAKQFIDCTGDASLCVMSGAECELGEELQPGSFNVTLAGFDSDAIDRHAADTAFAAACERGELFRKDVWPSAKKYCGQIWKKRGTNLNHVFPLNGADSESRSAAEPEARRSVARLLKWMKREIPGCEHAYVAAAAPESWPRESKRVVGEKRITGEAYVRGDIPADSVCYSFYPVDIHTQHDDRVLVNAFQADGAVPGIPYGALVPKGFKNLLVAGRCASGDRAAQSAFRVQASCMAMGEAAGTAAALACEGGCGCADIDVGLLRRTLSAHGMIVPGLDPFR